MSGGSWQQQCQGSEAREALEFLLGALGRPGEWRQGMRATARGKSGPGAPAETQTRSGLHGAGAGGHQVGRALAGPTSPATQQVWAVGTGRSQGRP